MLIQSRKGRKTYEDGLDDLDPYFSPPEAALSLLALEGARLPQVIMEPAAGGGAIVTPLRIRWNSFLWTGGPAIKVRGTPFVGMGV